MPHEPPTPVAQTSPIRPIPVAPPMGEWVPVSDPPPLPTPDIALLHRLEQPLPAIPGYEVVRELGRGGMGVVYLARDPRLNRAVALKTVRRDRADADTLARFADEARAVGKLHHPAVVPVYASGEFEGGLFLAMAYLPGGSLFHWLGGRPCSAHTAARIVLRLCEAVQAAHDAGILHRDIKPANVLLEAPCSRSSDDEPQVKLADFGLARLEDALPKTASGHAIGTPNYMPPEQAVGNRGETGPASDVYGLGAVLYECLTGRAPFQGVTPLEIIMQVVNNDPVPVRMLNPSVPRDIQTVCLKCLAKQPGQRYASANELAVDLRRFLDSLPVRARPLSALTRAWRWSRRRPVLVALLLACTVTAAVAVGSLIVAVEQSGLRRQQAEASAEREREQRWRAWRTLEALTAWSAEPGLFGPWELDPVRKQMLANLLARFEEFAADSGDDPESAEANARAMLRVAVIRAALRQANAEEAAEEACRRLQKTGSNSQGPEERHHLALAWQTLGEVQGRAGKPTAGESFRQARERYEAIVADAPGEAEPRRALAVCLLLDADRLKRASQWAEVKANLGQALTVLSGLPEKTARDPAYTRIVALTHLRHAQTLARDGKMREIEDGFRQALLLYEGLPNPLGHDAVVSRERCDCQLGIGEYLRNHGQIGEAEAMCAKAVAGYRQLLQGASSDPACRHGLARSLKVLGRLKTEAREPRAAREYREESMQLLRALCAEYPGNEELAALAGEVGVELAYTHRVARRNTEALPLYEEAVTHLESIRGQPIPENQLKHWRCEASMGRGVLYFGVGKIQEGTADMRRFIELSVDRGRRDWGREQLLNYSMSANQPATVIEMCEALTRDAVKPDRLSKSARVAATVAGRKVDAQLQERARRIALEALAKAGKPADPDHADWNAIREEPAFQALLK